MILIFFIAAAVLLKLLQLYYKKHWAGELSAKLAFDRSYIYEGDEASLYEVIENRKRLPVFILEVGFRVGRGIIFTDADNTNVSDYVYKRDVYSMGGFERITRTIRLTGKMRGYYPVSDVSLSGFSLFHKSQYLTTAPQNTSIYVYAKRVPLGGIMPALESIMGERESEKKFLEDPFAFASIREYTPQDPMKTVNWKATARQGELMVNTYASTDTIKLMILLDVEDSGIWKYPDLIEDGIRVAATMMQKLTAAGHDAGFAVNAENMPVLMPSKGSSQRHLAERQLTADFTSAACRPFETLFDIVPDDVVPVLISKNVSDDMMEKAVRQFGRTRRVLLVVPFEKEEKPQLRQYGSVFTIYREVAR